LLSDVESGAVLPEWVVYPVIPATDGTVPEQVRANLTQVLDLLQDWLQHPELGATRLAINTHNAIDTPDLDVTVAPVWGLVRSAQTEHPDRFALIDGTDFRAALATGEPQVTIRDGHARVPRLTKTTLPPPTTTLDGTVLVTGGTTGLGALTARHLVTHHHVRHLVLTSRRGPNTPGITNLVTELTNTGATVRVETCDVTNRDALATLLDTIDPPLQGVIHSAGTLDDTVLTSLNPERLHTVLAPKLDAAWHLHELTDPNTTLVLYSSVSGVLGGPGQANYAAANTFLDALAHHRTNTTAVSWGHWHTDTQLTGHL
ncbi:beta-ketoacyl reductase, partial [Actinophytocola gossypii]